MERGFPPAPSLESTCFLPLEHDPGLRRLGALLDTHEVDAGRSRAAAVILAELHLDAACIVAALLHDVVEDTRVPLDEIERHFEPAKAIA